ncbi:MAG TPA: hypothetical protein VNI20_06090 [Fimbriimonadaceae bacterium]|nr:hypothetical protein [Fimbriimonadaceae bacterium]
MPALRSGRSLVGVLVAVLIVIVAGVVFVTGGRSLMGPDEHPRPDNKGNTLVGKVLYAPKDTDCRVQIEQVRQAIQINTDPVDDVHPPSLKDLGLTDKFIHCPVGGEEYVYDPKTGKVYCPHAGHRKY